LSLTVGILVAGIAIGLRAQSDDVRKKKQEPPDPLLSPRPASKPQGLLITQAKIKLDVMVNDAEGKPVLGLEPWEFKILDNGQPRKVVSFRRFTGSMLSRIHRSRWCW